MEVDGQLHAPAALLGVKSQKINSTAYYNIHSDGDAILE